MSGGIGSGRDPPASMQERADFKLPCRDFMDMAAREHENAAASASSPLLPFFGEKPSVMRNLDVFCMNLRGCAGVVSLGCPESREAKFDMIRKDEKDRSRLQD